MRKLIITSFIMFLSAAPVPADQAANNTVKITVTSQGFNQDSPWKKNKINKYVISGSVLKGGRILTTSYPLADHVLVEVSKPGGTRKYPARVVVKDYHNGLAILDVEDKSFYDEVTPVDLAEGRGVYRKKGIIPVWDELGAKKEYTTETIKSSIRIYNPNCAVLMHQMHTTMNEGGDGEPILIDGKLAGIVTGLDKKNNTLYVIAADVIDRMLKDLDDGTYEGLPYFWIEYVSIESDENFREYLGMSREDEGIYVSRVAPLSSGSGILREGDVVLSINGVNIDDKGMYESHKYGNLNFYGIIFIDRFVGDTVTMNIIRDRKKMQISFPLLPIRDELFTVPYFEYDTQCRYIMYGGLIFQELTRGFMKTWGSDWDKKGDKRLLFYFEKKKINSSKEKERIVIMNRILPAPCNTGYQGNRNLILTKANGNDVKNLNELLRILEDSNDRYIRFDFVGGEFVILSREEVTRHQELILKRYNVTSPGYLGEQ